MNYPELPKGFRWKVSYNETFNLPQVVVKIKGRFLTKASGSSGLIPELGIRKAAEKAAREAHGYFVTTRHRKDTKNAVAQFQNQLNYASEASK